MSRLLGFLAIPASIRLAGQYELRHVVGEGQEARVLAGGESARTVREAADEGGPGDSGFTATRAIASNSYSREQSSSETDR